MKLIGYTLVKSSKTGKDFLILDCTIPAKSKLGLCAGELSLSKPLFARPDCIIEPKLVGKEVEFIYSSNDYGNPEIIKVVEK